MVALDGEKVLIFTAHAMTSEGEGRRKRKAMKKIHFWNSKNGWAESTILCSDKLAFVPSGVSTICVSADKING